ncbi:MAG TPA: glycosyltransferase family 2 protein, partial [Nitrospira sp.]|nr:glycosyltransferase family 2 protein [Nitrospira sp.]
MMTNHLISIIIPCYNEQEVISEAYRRLSALAASEINYRFEFIFVDDGSRDGTLELLRAIAANDERAEIIVFSRNFGHQLAVTAGLDEATGDAVVIIDADLQDPPYVIREMLERWSQGYAVVYGVRSERKGESGFKRLTAHWFYRLLNALSDIPIPLDTGDFRLIDKAVVKALRTMDERDRFIRGMVSWVGFKQYALKYQREQRFAGTTKYPLRKMLRFASDGVVSFSTKPLRIAMLSGVLSAGLACIGIIW